MSEGAISFDELACFCLFVGTKRSGTSVVGALLDAHPNALIAHELDVFEDAGGSGRLRFADRREVFESIARNSARMAARGRPGRRRTAATSYAVPGQHQGRATGLRVIGTKRAHRTMLAIGSNPDALAQLRDQVQLDLKLIHVVRNPYDNIASMTHRKRRELRVGRYVFVTGQVQEIRHQGWDVLALHLEDLILRPGVELSRLCEFLDLPVDPDWLAACSRIVLGEPHRTRDDGRWRPDELNQVGGLIAEVPWLERYQRDPGPARVG